MSNETLEFDDGPEPDAERVRIGTLNSKGAGMPPGTPLPRQTHKAEELANALTDRLLSGKGLPRAPLSTGRVPDDVADALIQRVSGKTTDEFQAMLSAELQTVAMLAVGKVKQAIAEQPQKLSDLNMSMAISIDKLQAVSGRAAQGAQVNVQINNYSGLSRSELMEQAKRVTGVQALRAG